VSRTTSEGSCIWNRSVGNSLNIIAYASICLIRDLFTQDSNQSYLTMCLDAIIKAIKLKTNYFKRSSECHKQLYKVAEISLIFRLTNIALVLQSIAGWIFKSIFSSNYEI
jgi:hypothetical protein